VMLISSPRAAVLPQPLLLSSRSSIPRIPSSSSADRCFPQPPWRPSLLHSGPPWSSHRARPAACTGPHEWILCSPWSRPSCSLAGVSPLFSLLQLGSFPISLPWSCLVLGIGPGRPKPIVFRVKRVRVSKAKKIFGPCRDSPKYKNSGPV
jgi:hypothetical protein